MDTKGRSSQIAEIVLMEACNSWMTKYSLCLNNYLRFQLLADGWYSGCNLSRFGSDCKGNKKFYGENFIIICIYLYTYVYIFYKVLFLLQRGWSQSS
jgi:hypothetical protein